MGRNGLLILCTGNSCRSQMAEGYVKSLAPGRFRVFSAGTEPAAEIHPLARRVMEEDGVELAGQYPKDCSELLGRVPVRTLIIVCDGAAKSCPSVWPGVHERLLWPFEDPAAFNGAEEEKLMKFRQVRDEIKARLLEWLAKHP